MNNFFKTLVALAATMALTAPINAAVHTAKRVIQLHEDGDRPCAIYRHEGVAEADPANGSPWFVLPRTHTAYTDLFAMLQTAKATNVLVTIHTSGTGTSSCDGFATVSIVMLE